MAETTIRAVLTREASGMYSLTSRPTVLALVDGTARYDACVDPGDSLGIRHLCPRRAAALFGVELRRLESIAVELTGRVVEAAEPVKLRQTTEEGNQEEYVLTDAATNLRGA